MGVFEGPRDGFGLINLFGWELDEDSPVLGRILRNLDDDDRDDDRGGRRRRDDDDDDDDDYGGVFRIGTRRDDTLVGTSKDDILIGLGGDDVLKGKAGDDLLVGGFGDDILKGGRGEDLLLGGFGRDVLKGGRDDDALFGGFGDDVLKGGRGDDLLVGGFGNDVLKGGAGDDLLLGGLGNFDVARFSGNRSDYVFDVANGTITDLRGSSPDGTDVYAGIEVFEFADQTVAETYTLQILHASDLEGGVDAIGRAPNFAAIVDALEDTHANTLILSAGDNYLPGPFFSAGGDFAVRSALSEAYLTLFGEDPAVNPDTGIFDWDIREGGGRIDVSIMNIIGFDASAIGNHEFDLGSDTFESIIEEDIRDMSDNGLLDEIRWLGAQFPYLSANLDFSGDGDLSNLFTPDILDSTAFGLTQAEFDAIFAAKDGTDTAALDAALAALTSKPKIAPATVIEEGGEKIGVVGATTQVIASISSPSGTVDTTGGQNDMAALAAALQPVIDQLTAPTSAGGQGVNKVIVVSHLQQFELEQELVTLLSGVDVVISGGSDTLLADDEDVARGLQPGDDEDVARFDANGDIVDFGTDDQPGVTGDNAYPFVTKNADGKDAVIVSTDGEYSYVGRLVLEFDVNGDLIVDSIDESVSGAFATTEDVVAGLYNDGDDTQQEALDKAFADGGKGAEVAKLTDAVTGVVLSKDSNVFGETEVFIDGRRESVRTEETNMGNLTADANLAVASDFDSSVLVSIKNGGGIRAPIGEIDGFTGDLLPTQGNPDAGKEPGQISQLDIENTLRFNNGLTLQTVTADQLKIIIEHAVSATAPGATPGQFPQIGGMRFSFDPNAQAQVLEVDGGGDPTGNVTTAGERVQSLVILNEFGDIVDVVVENGAVVGDGARPIRLVTLDFLAGGGDGYPFEAFADADPVFANRVDLEDVLTDPGDATFTDAGSEQDALAEFLADNHPVDDIDDFRAAEQDPIDDLRIQNLGVPGKTDTVLNGTKTIMEIQGAGHRSPFEGGLVTTVGIVTAIDSDGFFIQDAAGDGDIATSDGIFVLNFGGTGAQPVVGSEVTVTGTVQELQFGTDLSLTRISNPTFTVDSTGNALPGPVVLGVDRSAPTSVIDDDGLTSFDPTTDAIDFYESLEGMRVEVNDPLVVAGTSRFDEVGLAANRGGEVGVGNPVKNAVVSAGDFNPEILLTDDDLAPEPNAKTGDGFTSNPVGILDYTFGAYKLQLTSTPTVVDGGRAADVSGLTGGGSNLTVATYNVFNLDPGDATQAANIAATIVNNLNAPDIIALQEIQDNNGGTDDGTVAADDTLNLLIDAISNAGGPTYMFAQIDPVDNADGGAPGSNIRNAFLYDPTRVQLDGLSRIEDPAFDLNGDGSPEQADYEGTRKPLVGEFTFLPTSDSVTVIGNHLKSKRGDDGLFSEVQPPVEETLGQRVDQAEAINGFVEGLLSGDPNAKVVVLGDMNDFQFSDTLEALATGGDGTAELTNLIDGLPAEEQYSFIFNGNSQVLDHILMSDNLAAAAQADIVHVNLDFGFPFNNPSDHDPVLAQVDLSLVA